MEIREYYLNHFCAIAINNYLQGITLCICIVDTKIVKL